MLTGLKKIIRSRKCAMHFAKYGFVAALAVSMAYGLILLKTNWTD